MSRTATNEYIGARRRAYAEAKPARRRRILDEVCETTGHSRKYANRLLTGSRKFREHGGRDRTCTQEAPPSRRRGLKPDARDYRTSKRKSEDGWTSTRPKSPASAPRTGCCC